MSNGIEDAVVVPTVWPLSDWICFQTQHGWPISTVRREESEKLCLPDGTPVLEITRHAFQDDGRCVEVNRMILDATAYVLDYTFTSEGRPPSRKQRRAR